MYATQHPWKGSCALADAIYRFFGFELDGQQIELRAPTGRALGLGRKPFDLLLYLVEHRSRTVHRDELLDAVWPDTTVSDASLSTAVRQVRRAFDESGESREVIRTVSRRGYRFVAPVEVTALRSPPPADEAAGPPPRGSRGELPTTSGVAPALFGRDAIVRDWDALLARALAGQGGVLWLEGVQGAGKSYLAQQLVVRAEARGLSSVRVRCQRVAGTPALWPFVQLLRQLAERAPSAEQARIDPEESELLRLVGRLGVSYRCRGDAEPAEARFLLFDAVVRAVFAAARRAPLCVLLDDVHSADRSSRELLAMLASQVEPEPLLVIATARARGPDAGPRPEIAAVHELSPLEPEDARALVRAAAAGPLSDRRIEAIVAQAGGNPLLLREMARCAAEDSAGSNDDAEIPRTLRAIAFRRYAQLSSACRQLLAVAACYGEEFSPGHLPLGALPAKTGLGEIVREAEAASLVAAVPRSVHRYRFEQPLFRATIYEAMEPAQRARWHGLIAEQLEREAVEDEDTVAAIMHHYRAAQHGNKAAQYARRAAGRSAAIGAYDTAQQHLALAADGQRGAPIDATGRAELLLESAAARAGTGSSAEELQRLYGQAFDIARSADAPELLARAALGLAGSRQYRGAPMNAAPPSRVELRVLETALSRQAEHSVFQVLLEARLGVALAATDRQAEGLLRTARAAERAQALGDPRTLCEALLHRSRSLTGPDHASLRVATADEALLLARRAGLDDLERDAFFERAAARLANGDCDAAELADASDARHAADPSDALRRSYWGLLSSLADGDLSRTQALLDRATHLATRINPIGAVKTLPAFRWEMDRLAGIPAPVERIRATEFGRYKLAQWMGYGLLFALLDERRERTARVVHEMLCRRLDKLTRNLYWLPSLGVAAWAAFRFEDARAAHTIHDLLLPFQGQNVMASDGLVLHCPVSLYLACTAIAFGEPRRAHAYLDAAMNQAERLGVRTPQLIARKYRALLLTRQGKVRAGQRQLEAWAREVRSLGLFGLFNDLPELRDEQRLRRVSSVPPLLP